MRTSIEKKYAIVFTLLITIVIFVCWCANALLLTKYYMSRKLGTISRIYEQLDTASVDYGADSNQFKTIFENNTATFNCDILVLNQDMNVLAANVMDESKTTDRLLSYFFDDKDKDYQPRIIEKNDKYTMQYSKDNADGAGFLELYGVLSTGNPIVIRSAMAGINDNAKLANIFLAYIGLIAIVISYFIVKLITKTITKPVLKMVEISDKMANLDFDTKYEGNDENEIGLLGEHMNRMSMTLEKTICELKTANTELESELKKRSEIDEMRKDFLNNVSHELKTPIALIQGYAEGLEDCINDDAESREFYLDVIIDETNKMNKLVRNLLDLNELEHGNGNVTIERFDITELISNCIESFNVLIKQNDIAVEFDDSKSYMVWSDEFKIEQVFNNYLSNAINHVSGEKKTIRIVLSDIGSKIRISVYNTGDNIPEADLDKLFDKFYKVDKARTREYGGNGIGLSIVKAAMDSLNQNYGVVNCEGGVEFWFEVDSK
ncbi:MAG: HAMP domain-containing sensor histidine kinase [Lachnospiraceae bacterium]|nr:HAMP domain-containing sensor histidine kinase [Lachnospiraceae bacterium]